MTKKLRTGVGRGRAAAIMQSRPGLKVRMSSLYVFECFDKHGNLKWRESAHNLVVDQGVSDMLAKYFLGSAYTAAWFVGLLNNASFGAIAAGDTAAKITTSAPSTPTTNGWSEFISYTGAARKTLVLSAPAGGSTSNALSKASFVFTASGTIKGAFTATASGLGATTGILYGAVAFTNTRIVELDDALNVTVTLTAEDAG